MPGGARLGACLSIPREPRWQGRISVRCSWAWPTPLDSARGADARRAAPPVVVTTGKPCNAADAPLLANPSGPGRFPLMRRCRLLIGYLPNLVGSALPEGKSAAVAATGNTQTGSWALHHHLHLRKRPIDNPTFFAPYRRWV